jgi:hypothetical protein
MPFKLLNTLIALLVSLSWIILVDESRGQEFPYIVPAAPEFESPGSVGKTPVPAVSTDQNKPVRSAPGVFRPQLETGAMNPSSVPEAPLNIGNNYDVPRSGPVRGPTVESQPAPYPKAPRQNPVASVPPAGPAPGSRPQSDCSEFPMLIERSRSDTEMQMTARHYLTCLMQGGWTMEQAREQVIRTIETAYRPGR